MTGRQKLYISTVVPALAERCYEPPAPGAEDIIDEMADALGGKSSTEAFVAVGVPLCGIIGDTLIVMGAADKVPVLTALLRIVFGVAYDLGRIGALDEMRKGDDQD